MKSAVKSAGVLAFHSSSLRMTNVQQSTRLLIYAELQISYRSSAITSTSSYPLLVLTKHNRLAKGLPTPDYPQLNMTQLREN